MIEKNHLLATDLDGTLIGNRDGTNALLSFYKEQPFDVFLIYITGRHFKSALNLILEENIPYPNILICDVGTTIYKKEEDGFTLDLKWKDLISNNWFPEKVAEVAANIDQLMPQPIPMNSRLSFTVNHQMEPVKLLKKKLLEEKVPHKLIFSSGKDVDVLPPESGKGEALTYILKEYGLTDHKILVAGDSGNDKEMISLGYPSVIVGNAQEELVKMKEMPMVYRAKEECASGILEAWKYFYNQKLSQ